MSATDFQSRALPDRKPDYYWSFSGCYIFRRWYLMNGLKAAHAEVLVLLSYYEYIRLDELCNFGITKNIGKPALRDLLEMKFVSQIMVQGKRKGKTVTAYILTQKGKDFEKDYERFWDEKYEQFTKQHKFKIGEERAKSLRVRKPITELRDKHYDWNKVGKHQNYPGRRIDKWINRDEEAEH